ncbi:MAG: hypothetical protein Pg6C_04580 [Treponemataceae bacterium]|nr:MAG: hypothetical protein Pg6C_04580 [Treponemataceae bacterium]
MENDGGAGFEHEESLPVQEDGRKMKKLLILFAALSAVCAGCASIHANNDLNMKPENLARGDPMNSARAKEYLQNILAAPEGYEVRAFNRKPYSVDTKKTLFMSHSFYVFYKDGEMEHTLVFTATPKGSVQNGSWMLDASSDRESYRSFLESPENPWEVAEHHGSHGETTLDVVLTAQKIIARLDKGYRFFGGAIVRDLAWYHQVWMFLVPPPPLAYAPLLLASVHADNCTTAVLDTMVWQRP